MERLQRFKQSIAISRQSFKICTLPDKILKTYSGRSGQSRVTERTRDSSSKETQRLPVSDVMALSSSLNRAYSGNNIAQASHKDTYTSR